MYATGAASMQKRHASLIQADPFLSGFFGSSLMPSPCRGFAGVQCLSHTATFCNATDTARAITKHVKVPTLFLESESRRRIVISPRKAIAIPSLIATNQ